LRKGGTAEMASCAKTAEASQRLKRPLRTLKKPKNSKVKGLAARRKLPRPGERLRATGQAKIAVIADSEATVVTTSSQAAQAQAEPKVKGRVHGRKVVKTALKAKHRKPGRRQVA
jgi:hypothetical protein